MYFYLVLAVCLLAGRWRWAAFAAWFALTLIVAPLALVAASLTNPFLAFEALRLSLSISERRDNPIVWEFVGARWRGLFTIRSLRLALGGLGGAGDPRPARSPLCYPGYSHGPTQWGWCFVLIALTLAIASKDGLRVHPLLLRLGDMSYTLYLVHVIAIQILSRLLRENGLTARIPSPFFFWP